MSNKSFGAVLLLATFIAGSANAVESDSDHDGVVDALDRCPNTAQLKKLPADFKYATAVNQERLKPDPRAYPVDAHGCEPDNDGDGIVNSQDYCPEDTPQALSMGIAPNGCPKHSDLDGTPDYRDKCPNTPRGIKTDAFGCPVVNRASPSL
ncbi:MAG: thrombospondin type 3 repeat-containing protein [gamma proteobacterium endosymbiont of Lamellibrachia anaximandri]|nr:thrombospondin type 3 repeat-containing protein [gamma proteobacterium endosymbiont of Lamellibrachia anaximandri]